MYCEKCHKNVLVPSPESNLCINCYEIEHKNDKIEIDNGEIQKNKVKSYNKNNEENYIINKEKDINFYLVNYSKIVLIISTIIGLCYSIYLATDCYVESGWIIFFVILFSFPFAYLIIKAIESIFNMENIVKKFQRKNSR